MITKIEWTNEVWNPVTGCTKVSQGCKHSYAERLANRFWGEREFTDVLCHDDRLDIPLKWRKPRKVFVNSMSDLFHPNVPDAFVLEVWRIMHAAHQHTYQILTKRPERMYDFVKQFVEDHQPSSVAPNIWLGISAEDQETADKRIPFLLNTPAAVRFLSCEPLLAAIDLSDFQPFRRVVHTGWKSARGILSGDIDWVICGGESGPKARPMHPDWARSLRDQCVEAGVPFFFKQWGEWEATTVENVLFSKPNRHDGKNYARLMFPNEREHWMARVGKKRAGRLLDGVEWNEYPEVINDPQKTQS